MQQPPSSLPYCYPQALYNQDGGGTAVPQWPPDNSKTSQYQMQWENSSFHVTAGGNNYGPNQVQGGGGQSRVQVGPQQQQQPSQPTPTSTPPGIHGEMNKQPLMPNQPNQLAFVQTRGPTAGFTYSRGAMPPQPQLRTHGARTPQMSLSFSPMSLHGMLTPAPAQAIVQTVPYSTQVMYGHPRQGGPYNSGLYVGQGNFYSTPPYYQSVIQPTFQGMSSGGPSPQASGQQTPVQMVRPVVPVVQPVKQEAKKLRPNAIKIINPNTYEEVAVDTDSAGNNNNITPTRSNDSSARETPQPNAGAMDNAVAAEFAARVAARAMASEPQSPPSDKVQDSISSDSSDVHHKQQPIVVPSSEKMFNTVLSTKSEEFIPRSHKQQAQLCEPTIEETRVPVVPTVSAETNSPAIEIPRPKEQFPALKNTMAPSPPIIQSPLKVSSKKQKGGESERQLSATVPSAAQVPLPPPENKDNPITNKKGPKTIQKEEVIPAPKEKREKTRSLSKEQSPALSPVNTSAVSTQPEIIPVTVIKPVPLKTAGTFSKDTVKSNNVAPPTTAVNVEEPPAGPVNKAPQHQNGEVVVPETPPVFAEGNKATRPKNKKAGKMREFNRKGVDKEGSDMDAFTTEPTIMSEDKERPETPVSPPPKIPPTPPVAVEPVAPPSPVDKIKEDLEEKEDTLVASKNEENAMVSAIVNKDEEELQPPVEKPVPQLTLKRSYKKDQWSPLNQDGKKKYDRDFLMELKQDTQSQVKPENLPDIVAVLKDSNNMRNQNNMNFMISRDNMSMIMPQFTQRGGSQSQRGQLVPKRGSQQGNNKGKGNPKVIHMSLSLHEDVKLRTAENAWKPTRLASEAEKSEDEKQNMEVYKNVRSILNKLTPQKFDTLMKKFMQIPINSETRLIETIRLIFEKAVDEPNFSKAYANMCKNCSKLEVTRMENGKEEKVNFRKILITRCQTEFESNKSEEVDAAKWMEDINNCSDPEKKKELQSQFEEKERMIRMKSVGNIRFIGELYKLGMLTSAIMYRCIEHLLQNPQEESLECLCKLLTTIGKDLEKPPPQNQNPKAAQTLNPYFNKMSELAQKKENSKISSRVRFMLQDVIELRQNNWVPRREDNNPKTIEQINKEAERESYETTLALSNQPPPRMNRPNDRQDDPRKRGGNRGNNNSQNDDGWATVNNSRHYHNKFAPSFDSNKMQSIAKSELDLNNLNLGGSQAYRFTTVAAKNVDSKTGASFASTNTFSALSRGEERKPPQSNMNNRRITPTPSIERERERQRMIQGTMEREGGHSSRGSSAQRDRPLPPSEPPSRDSSMPRQLSDNKEVTEMKFKREEDKPERIMDEKSNRLAEEKLERQTNTILEEYLADSSSPQDVKLDIEQVYPLDRISNFVEKSLQIALEKKAGAQKKIGILITALMDYNVFSTEVLVEQLSLIYETADDIAIDVPKVWELQAQVIVPILAAEKMNFSHFKAACSSVLKSTAAPKLLLPVFKILIQEKGAGFVRELWSSSNVSLIDFLPDDTILDAFIKENSLEYLIGDAPSYDGSSNQLSMDQVQEKMLGLMQKNEPFDVILDFISSNVGDKVKDLHFIRALMTAICEACMTGPNYNVDSAKFKEYGKLIQRYIDNKEDRELACLNSVHILLTRLQHPQGLLKYVFNLLLENGLICSESFLKWKDDHETLENKGVTLLSLTSFFTALQDVESEDENS